MTSQFTKKPLDDWNTKLIQQALFKYNLVEVQHMAGITPIPRNQIKNSYESIKNNILVYDEAPIEIYEDTTLHNKYVYLDKNDIDYNFFKKSYDFLLTLSDLELKCLNLYTGPDGFKLINFFHENKNDKEKIINKALEYVSFTPILGELFKIETKTKIEKLGALDLLKLKKGEITIQEETEDEKRNIRNNNYILYQKFYETLSSLFKKCPKTTKEIRLFRGIKIIRNLNENFKVLDFYGFNSTSYVPSVAANLEFLGPCCLLEIKVKPGVPIIWISPISKINPEDIDEFGKLKKDNTEYEFLLFSEALISTILPSRSTKDLLYHGKPMEYYVTTYDVIVEPRTSRNILDKWKSLSTQPTSHIESDAYKGSQQGKSRKRKTIRKRKNNRKTYKK